MNFRLEVVCINDDGEQQRGDVLTMERRQLAMETLGLNLSESRVLLERVQDFVVARQAAEDLEQRRGCPSCGERYTSKAGGTIEVKTLFGAVAVANPRWNRCQCQGSGPKTFRPATSWLRGQTSPELLYLETKWASLIPFAKVADLLREVLPVDAANHETVRQHLRATAQRMEEELGEERQLRLFEGQPEDWERQPPPGERRRQGETISTAFVESTINQVVSRRFVKKQQMQWTLRGAHLRLQTRTKVLNNELEEVFRRWYPRFRAQAA